MSNGERRGLDLANEQMVIDALGKTRGKFLDQRRERFLANIAGNRDGGTDNKAAQYLKNGSLRPFCRRDRWQFAAAGTPSTFVDFTSTTYQPKPYPNGKTDQPEDDGILIIDEIGIELNADLKQNTYEVLRDQFGVKIHYPGDKKPRVVPLAEVLEAGGVYAQNAGNATGTAVAGTNHIVRPGMHLLKLRDDEKLVVYPKESQVKLEFVRLPAYASNPALTGETAALYFHVTWKGERHATNHETF